MSGKKGTPSHEPIRREKSTLLCVRKVIGPNSIETGKKGSLAPGVRTVDQFLVMGLQFFLQLGQPGVGFAKSSFSPASLERSNTWKSDKAAPLTWSAFRESIVLSLPMLNFPTPSMARHGDPAVVEGAVIDPDQGLFRRPVCPRGQAKSLSVQGQVFRGWVPASSQKVGRKSRAETGRSLTWPALMRAGQQRCPQPESRPRWSTVSFPAKGPRHRKSGPTSDHKRRKGSPVRCRR